MIAALWVDNHAGANLARRPDDLERHPFRQHAFGIVGDHHYIRVDNPKTLIFLSGQLARATTAGGMAFAG